MLIFLIITLLTPILIILLAKIIFRSNPVAQVDTPAILNKADVACNKSKDNLTQALKILDEIIEELPQTRGGINISLLCSDLKQARKYLE